MADPVDAGSIAVAVVPSAKDFTERMRASLLPQADRLGREVGDRIRAGVDSRLKDVKVGVGADTAKANAELDKTKVKADELGRKDEKIKVNVQNSGGVMGWLVSAVAAAVAIAPAFAVAGVGVAAFTALAIPSLKAVTQYEHDVATGSAKATTEWQKMTGAQHAMAAGLTSLSAEFHQASSEIDPQVMQVFEAAVSDIARVLPEVVPLAKAAGSSIAGMLDAIGNALTDSQAQQFFAFVAKNIGPDMQEIDQVVVALVHTLFSLIEALQPVSLLLLHLVAGFADLLSWVSRVAPPLDAIIILAIALYRPLQALQGLELAKTFSWIPQAVTWWKDFTVATEGATLAEKANLAVGLAIEAVNPFWWIAGAVAGGIALGVVLRNVSNGIQGQIKTMGEQDKAAGYNIAGYQKLSQQAGAYAQHVSDVQKHTALVGQALGHAQVAQQAMTAAQQQASAAAANLNNHLNTIQATFGLTRTQAEQLAKAAGVTADQLTGTGSTAQEAMRKILAYGHGQDAATGTTHSLTIAVEALTAAMQANVSAVLTLEGDEVSWKQAQQAATKALDQNKHSLDGNSASALAARQAVIQATSAVVQFASDQLKLHGNLQGASNAIQNQISWLEKHAGKSKIAAQEIKALRQEEAKIKSEIKSRIEMSGTGKWTLQGVGLGAPAGTSFHLGQKTAPFAYGGIVPGVDRGVDSQLILARPGEAVVPVHAVGAVAPILSAYGVPGFAQGGIVPSYSGSIPGQTTWLQDNLNATFSDMASSLASSFASSMSASLPSGPLSASAGKAEAFARSMLSAFGWGASQWPSLQALWTRESGWNAYAVNPSSGAYGIPQSLGHGHPYALGDYVAQVMWGLRYILGRYGSPAAAWGHEVSAGWYDSGGWLPPGAIALNGTGRPEPILSDAQWQMLSGAASGGDGSAATEYHAHFDGASTQALQSTIRTSFRAMEMQAGMKQRVGRRR